MKVLFLTNNANLGSTARILQSWLELGPGVGIEGFAVAPRPGDLARWLETERVPHLVDPMPWPERSRPIRSLWHPWKIARWARRQGVDLIHCNEHDVYPFGRMLRQILRRPLVCHARFRLSRPFCEWAFGGPDRRPDALLWTSRWQREDSAESVAGLVPEDRQRVLYLGLDLNRFGTLAAGREESRRAWEIGPDEIVIGTASALRPIKRLEDFVALVSGLARDDPRVVGLIAGDAPPGGEAYREELLGRIEAATLSRRLRWLGNQEPIEPFLHAIDIFVSTSECETFGNSVCEAMACRRPVAAYSGGSVKEVVGNAGRIVATGDLPALRAEVANLVERPTIRVELGERGRDRVVERFNPAEGVRQLKDIYESLLVYG